MEAQPHAQGVRIDVQRFKTRQKATEYVVRQVPLVRLRSIFSPDVVLFTDGSALLGSGSTRWRVYLAGASAPPDSRRGPVITELSDPEVP